MLSSSANHQVCSWRKCYHPEVKVKMCPLPGRITTALVISNFLLVYPNNRCALIFRAIAWCIKDNTVLINSYGNLVHATNAGWSRDLGYLKAKSTDWTLCHVPQTGNVPFCPNRCYNAIKEYGCYEEGYVYLVLQQVGDAQPHALHVHQ